MKEEAEAKLFAGERLSWVDERLLDGTRRDRPMLLAYAKNPSNLPKSREALGRICETEDLENLALNAAFSEIRKEAAGRVSGLPESRFAELVRVARDDAVARIFLKKVSDEELLRGIVEDIGARSLAEEALAKIRSEAGLARFVKSPDGPLEMKKAALLRIRSKAVWVDVARHAARPEIRATALSRLGDAGLMRSIALEDPSPAIRLAALRRVADVETLMLVVRKDPVAVLRIRALERIMELDGSSNVGQTEAE